MTVTFDSTQLQYRMKAIWIWFVAALCLLLTSASAAAPVAFRVQFGLTDTEPSDWSGSLRVSGGEVTHVRNWRPRPDDQVDDASWRLATREGPQRQGAADNIILDYRLRADGEEHLQGDVVGKVRDFRLWVNVVGTAAILQIDIIKNNRFVHTRQNLGREVSFTFVDNELAPGESYYYVRVIQVDDQIAWSSPIWVTEP